MSVFEVLIAKKRSKHAVVVAQLVERSLLSSEVRGLNPVIGDIFINFFTINCIEKTKINKKRP